MESCSFRTAASPSPFSWAPSSSSPRTPCSNLRFPRPRNGRQLGMRRRASGFDSFPPLPGKVFVEEAIGVEYGEGFETFRMDGPLKVDVDYLNERLQECFLQRMRHAMKPDEAFGLIFSWDNVIADTDSLKLDAWRQLALEEGKDIPTAAHVQKSILHGAADHVLRSMVIKSSSRRLVDKSLEHDDWSYRLDLHRLGRGARLSEAVAKRQEGVRAVGGSPSRVTASSRLLWPSELPPDLHHRSSSASSIVAPPPDLRRRSSSASSIVAPPPDLRRRSTSASSLRLSSRSALSVSASSRLLQICTAGAASSSSRVQQRPTVLLDGLNLCLVVAPPLQICAECLCLSPSPSPSSAPAWCVWLCSLSPSPSSVCGCGVC